jgi:uncharacterized protein YlzI (FlbEa/FlbD family)
LRADEPPQPRRRAAATARVEEAGVISLVRQNGHPVIVNVDLIETVERAADGTTVVNLTTGNVLVVVDTPEAVRDAAIAYRRSLGLPAH